MMGMMYMHFYWGCDFIFLFNSWATQAGECNKFGWYVVLAVVLTALTDLVPYFKEILVAKRSKEISFDSDKANQSKFGYYFLLFLLQSVWIMLSICVMLLIMSFNYGMVIAIVATKSVVYCCTSIPKLLRGPLDVSYIAKNDEFNGACH